MPELFLQYFGGVCLKTKESEFRNFGTVRAAKLLVLLSLSRSGRMSRSQLAELLWPDDFYDSTRLRLRQEIHRLKRALGTYSDLIRSDQNDVWLDKSNLNTDFDSLDRIAAGKTSDFDTERLDHEFLPGWNETWVLAERSQVSSKLIEAAVTLGNGLLAAGKPEDALRLARKLIPNNPLSEALRMIAVNAHSKLGSLTAAVAEYQEYRAKMRSDLGIEVEPFSQEALQSASPIEFPEVDWSKSIPQSFEPMFGRETVFNDVLSRIARPDVRMVTLIGPGGIGKSRLAVEVARHIADRHETRVAFASMVGVSEPEEWTRAILSQLKEDPPADVNAMSYLIGLLKRQKTLLVVDNFETVLPRASQDVDTMLSEVDDLTLLLTSTVPSKSRFEKLTPIGPIDPTTDGLELLESLLLAIRPKALEQPGVHEDLLRIAEKLDGYPLAIRLAAARLRLLTPSQLLDQLDVAFTSGGHSDLPERHRSLGVALSSSVNALSIDLRKALERIATYPGGLSMDVAAIEFEGEPYLDYIESLLDAALISLDEQFASIRIRVLSPIRLFLESELETSEIERLKERAVSCIWRVLATFDVAPWKPLPHKTLLALVSEGENLLFAWRWSSAHRPSIAFPTAPQYTRFEIARGQATIMANQLESLCESWSGETPELKASMELCLAYVNIACHREDQALPPLERARTDSSRINQARIELARALCEFRLDFPKSFTTATEALKLSEQVGDAYLMARCHKTLANFCNFMKQDDVAIKHYHECYRLFLQSNADSESGTSGITLAFALWFVGRTYEATGIMERSKATLELTREPAALAHAWELEGRLLVEQRKFVEAEACFRESLQIWQSIGSVFQEADQNHSIARTLIEQERWQDAARQIVVAADLWFKDNNKGGLCCAVIYAASVLYQLGRVDDAKRVLAFAIDFEASDELVLVKGELDVRDRLLTKVGNVEPNEIPVSLESAHRLFDLLREASRY